MRLIFVIFLDTTALIFLLLRTERNEKVLTAKNHKSLKQIHC